MPATPALPAGTLQAALDALPTLALVDPEGRIVAVNAAWRRFQADNGGSEHSCGVGANYLHACEGASGPLSAEAAPVADGLRGVLLGTLGEYRLDYPCHSPTEQRWYRVHIRPVQDGAARYAMVLHENITDQKLAEIRASDLDAEVAQGVRAQTAALREENRELDAFAGSVSHDLKAPVRHLSGFLRLLRRQALPRLNAEDLRLLDVLDGATERLAHMIDELLALARTAHTPVSMRAVDLGAVVRQAWARLAPETGGREIEWISGALPTVRGDAELLVLAFENLLSNALKYTAGRARARIEVGAREEAGAWVVYVRDDGAGFDPRYKDRLFQAFGRLHHERDFPGIGLGLTNVRRIAERHGATVWAQGHPGDGATFYLRFPRATP